MFPAPSRRGVSGARLTSRVTSAVSSSSPVVLCGLFCASVVLLVFLASYLPAVLLPLLGVSVSSRSDAVGSFSPLSASELVSRASLGRADVSAAAAVAAARSAASLPSILEWRPPSSLAGVPAAPLSPHAPAAPAAPAVATNPVAADADTVPATSSSAWRARADAVKAGFVHAYSKYEAKCFGQDEYRPVRAAHATLHSDGPACSQRM